jgi:hypothetical protein
MHPALQLSEILRNILEYLYGERKSHYAATLVNRAWAGEAGAILWRYAPIRALLAVPTERRQHYASPVRSLDFFNALDAESAASLSWLQYPRLICLALFVNLEPGVTFAGRCPCLQVLHAASRPTWTAPHDTFELQRTNAATLTQVNLPFAITLPILARLAELQRLANLRLCGPGHDGRLLSRRGTSSGRGKRAAAVSLCGASPSMRTWTVAGKSWRCCHFFASRPSYGSAFGMRTERAWTHPTLVLCRA